VGADPGRLRVGFRTHRGGERGDASADAVAAVRATVGLLEGLGHIVEPTDLTALDDERFGQGLLTVFPAFVASELSRWSTKLGQQLAPSDLDSWNQMQAEVGAAVTATQYVAAIEHLQAYARHLAQWWADGNDILVTPMVPDETPRLGELGPTSDMTTRLAKITLLTSFSMPFNVTGQPAISLPLHWGQDGMPVGVQLVAAYAREDVLLRVASQLEEAMPWRDRRPPTSA
jgi:amidase